MNISIMDKIYAAYMSQYVRIGRKFLVSEIQLPIDDYIAFQRESLYIITKNVTIYPRIDVEHIVLVQSEPFIAVHNFIATKSEVLDFTNFYCGGRITQKNKMILEADIIRLHLQQINHYRQYKQNNKK